MICKLCRTVKKENEMFSKKPLVTLNRSGAFVRERADDILQYQKKKV